MWETNSQQWSSVLIRGGFSWSADDLNKLNNQVFPTMDVFFPDGHNSKMTMWRCIRLREREASLSEPQSPDLRSSQDPCLLSHESDIISLTVTRVQVDAVWVIIYQKSCVCGCVGSTGSASLRLLNVKQRVCVCDKGMNCTHKKHSSFQPQYSSVVGSQQVCSTELHKEFIRYSVFHLNLLLRLWM